MAKVSTTLGAALVAIAIALVIGFGYFAISNEEFRKAALLKERNPGHAAYEIQYFAAATIRFFLIGGAVVGVLLGLNGVTLMLLGRVAAAQHEGVGRGDRY
jgi:hypothetical protein